LYLAPGNFDWTVYAVDIEDGRLLWSFTPDEAESTPTYVSGVAIGDDVVYVVSGYAQQHLYCLMAGTGKLQWKAELGPATRFRFSSTPLVTESTVYVAASSGKLKSFEVGTGVQTWEYDLGAKVLSSASLANGTLYVATFDGTLYAFH
jgi:outer membrane protein assembly factor BamB